MEQEKEVVADLLLSMGLEEGSGRRREVTADELKKDLLGDSVGPECNNGRRVDGLTQDSPKFHQNLQFSASQNIYNSTEVSQYLERFANEKFQLVDFRTKLRKHSVLSLAEYFREERDEDEAVLVGYISKILAKLMEVSSSEMVDFLDGHSEVLGGLVKNVAHSSVAQFLVALLSDNFVVKEKKTELRSEELVLSRNLEQSYGKGFDSRSKNKLFRDCSETLFDFQKNEIAKILEKGNLLLLKDIIKEEIQEYHAKLGRAKLMLRNTFRNLLRLAHMDTAKTPNVTQVVFDSLNKVLDLVCEEVGVKGVNTYMNRMNR